MSDGGGSSVASVGKCTSSVPTGQSILQGASIQSDSCQSAVDIATLVDDAWACLLVRGRAWRS